MFITFEGSEGSGKTSHILPLAEFLRSLGYAVFTTREPGGTPIGDRVRSILLDLQHTEMHRRTEILLLQASRAQLVEQVIRPHLQEGQVVLCDRFADSSLAYQGYGYGIDPEQLRPLVEFATCGLKPDLTLLLDVDVEEGLRRKARGSEWNRLDAYTVDFYQRVRQGYFELVRFDPGRWVIVDANRPLDQVEEEIRRVVGERLKRDTYSNSGFS
jgi:dTMP kinase